METPLALEDVHLQAISKGVSRFERFIGGACDRDCVLVCISSMACIAGFREGCLKEAEASCHVSSTEAGQRARTCR